MKTVPQTLFILLLIIKNFSYGEELSQNEEITTVNIELGNIKDNTTESADKNLALEINQKNSTDTFLKLEDSRENTNNYNTSEAEISLKDETFNQTSNLNETFLIQIVLKEPNEFTIKPKEFLNISESSTESSAEFITNTTLESETTPKPLVPLEEYAVKQMNFILDHLLLETQEFIAKVLQASVNSVFPRDHLKRYAESLNRLLNPDNDSEYSDEIIEDRKVLTQDELYEEILHKLNFLKSNPSKYLQRHLPQDWVNDYRNKRAELAIWLGKASEQMHKEFNRYVSEEEDQIKCRYFSEAFDDISRATEIHHKLALLADLVKIVKNKKQITFMDLYMQT